MKTTSVLIAALFLTLTSAAFAEKVHQTLPGEKASAGDGSTAISKKLIDLKEDKKADSGKLARLAGSVSQWGFVNYWFGIPTPEGKSVLRLRVLVTEDEVAQCGLYIRPASGGQTMIGKIQFPKDAKPGEYVNLDFAVDSKEEWSGAVVKKVVKNDLPGVWVDTISVVLP